MEHKREEATLFARIHRFFRQKLQVGLSRSIAGNALSAVLLCVMGAFTALPLVYVIVSAFKPLDEFFLFPPTFFVQNPTLQNFRDLFVLMQSSWVPFTRYIFNTLFITAVGTFLHIIFASMAAYVLEKHRFPGRKMIFAFITGTLMFSPVVTWVPNMLIMNTLHMMDTYWAVLIPVVGMPLGLFLMKQFMSGIPDALIEAARIDGMKEVRLFFQIVMPIVKPAWLTLMILCIQNLWNTTGSFYIRSEQLKTLPYAMNNIITSGGAARAGAGAVVGLILVSVPILVFLFCQNSIIETMASSGIKE